MFVAYYLEVGVATTNAPIVTSALPKTLGVIVFACVSIKSYGQPASICGVTGDDTGKHAEEQLNAARVGD